jgi:hypothetical protein
MCFLNHHIIKSKHTENFNHTSLLCHISKHSNEVGPAQCQWHIQLTALRCKDMTKGKGSSALPSDVTKTGKGKGGSIAETTTGAPIAETTTGTAIAMKLQRTATTKGNSALGGSIAKTTTGAPIATMTTGTASRLALLQPPTSMNTNVEDTLMQPPPPQPETTKTKSMSTLPSMLALMKPTTSTNNSGNKGTLMQPPLLQPDTNNKKGKTTMPAATTKGNSASGDSIAKTSMGAPIATMRMGTTSRPALLQPPTLTNTNVEDTSMQLPLPQPETTEKKTRARCQQRWC